MTGRRTSEQFFSQRKSSCPYKHSKGNGIPCRNAPSSTRSGWFGGFKHCWPWCVWSTCSLSSKKWQRKDYSQLASTHELIRCVCQEGTWSKHRKSEFICCVQDTWRRTKWRCLPWMHIKERLSCICESSFSCIFHQESLVNLLHDVTAADWKWMFSCLCL